MSSRCFPFELLRTNANRNITKYYACCLEVYVKRTHNDHSATLLFCFVEIYTIRKLLPHDVINNILPTDNNPLPLIDSIVSYRWFVLSFFSSSNLSRISINIFFFFLFVLFFFEKPMANECRHNRT